MSLVTLGQYLRPSPGHLPVARYYHPDEFAALAEAGRAMGFAHVEAGPLVRSSYHAKKQADTALAEGPNSFRDRSVGGLGGASRTPHVG